MPRIRYHSNTPSAYRLPIDDVAASRRKIGCKIMHFDQGVRVVIVDAFIGADASTMFFDYPGTIREPEFKLGLKQRWSASARIQHLNSSQFEDPWQADRKKIRSFGQLPANWDSYGSPAIGEKAISAALEVLDAASQTTACTFAWASPTSDESILMQLSLPGATMKFEVDRDGDIGVMVEQPGQEPDFRDLLPEQLTEFFAEQENGTHD